MNILVWHIWIIIAVLLSIIEIFFPTFFAACVALGCIAAGISSYFGYGIEIQLVSFSIGTLIGLFGVRPFMLKYVHRKSIKVKTNTNALVGKIGKVIVMIDNSKNEGRVIVEGDDWRAETETDEIISAGEKVEVIEINSTILIVKPLKK
jgi:membrane protein implicated in regulation of membrane protease activity